MRFIIAGIVIIAFCGCRDSEEPTTSPVHEEFKTYWYQGLAEVNSYVLSQARYGELRQGTAVMIFVTEPFSMEKHLKLEDDGYPNADKIDVLKLNFTKDFTTGIYPYHMMSSIFTPIDRINYPNTLKTTTTCQEWCGQTFTNIDLRENYEVQLFSYFPTEGEQEYELESAVLEDELWNMIRIAPDQLPLGEFNIIQSSMYQRLTHQEFTVAKAIGNILSDEAGFNIYTIQFEENLRTLEISFEENFPHRILSWTETYVDGKGEDAPTLTTTATLIKSIQIDYWNRNLGEDDHLREELGLE